MSEYEKNEVLDKAKLQVESILVKNDLTFPYNVCLKDFDLKRDIYFRTSACYQKESFIKGTILIEIKSHLICNNIDIITHMILHEYSHAIYEVALTHNFYLLIEINKLQKYYTLLDYKTSSIKNEFELAKEQFCEFFPFYLMGRIVSENVKTEYPIIRLPEAEREEVEKICTKIVKDFMCTFK
ncbi:hypothetical protein EO95_17395 [Methanosarcina sp. 1.H.T.1A.1]|uniref:hypothetical protein n=1 Tax=Methanosarcina sp. 1.H.T.1A.1 TaxID=1483602 RepID=UPI000622A885|nr:hypothetical protein [Methanosarcina sp. 1.H.T.1A.1]KKH93079.1 hypothetical protein EO95_17395 [Methanosarcina sp. 1.H.T.1A.1]